jgi:hypothetical protein
MPPRYLRKRSPTKLQPCAERMVEACDNAPADQCCGVIPCKLCLEWETYTDGISYGSATFATSSWTGTVGGYAFVSYWERNYESGECEYIVTFNGEEVYRATCYQGASCRNPDAEVAVSTSYLEGTLRWSKYEPRELALAVDPDTGCNDFFCGTCRCSCDCLCVTVTEYGGDISTGEICDVSYPCDAPVWEGAVGYYDLSIALGRDQYGECIVTATVNGEEQDPVSVTGCADMTATITLADGTTIDIRCKQCTCDDGSCVGCCFCSQSPATNADYVIDAPNCAELDGLTGNVSGPDTGTPTDCGSCVDLINSLQSHSVPTFVYDDSIPENGCVPQPGADFQFRFALRCGTNQPDSETDAGTTDPCCRNVRLVVLDAGTDTVQRIIAPSSCTCDPDTGLMAIFPLTDLYPDCTTFFSGGVCDGLPTCSQIGDGPGGSCSLTGATVTFTQNC